MSATSLYEATLFIRDYSSFLDARAGPGRRGERPAPRGFERLTAEEVSFTYPDATRPGGRPASRSRSGAARSSRWWARTVRARRPWRRCSRGSTGRTGADSLGRHRPAPRSMPTSCAARSRSSSRTSSGTCCPPRENIGLGRSERIDDLDAIVEAAAARRTPTSSSRACPRATRRCSGREFSRRLRPLDRPVAAGRSRPRLLPRRPVRDPRRADRRARRAGRAAELFERMRELLAGPLGPADLAPLLERPLGRPDLRPRRRADRRGRARTRS